MLETTQRIKTKSDLKDWISHEGERYDIKRGFGFFVKYKLKISERAILYHLQIVLRKAEYYANSGKRILAKIYAFKLARLENRYGIHIPLNTCAKGLKIMHLGSVLINQNAKIGQDCSIHINTAIVAGGLNSDAPTIGDHVVIGVGSTLLGNITIPNYSAIGAGAVVNKSFDEENIAIAGVPAKKVSDNGSKNWNKPKTE